MRTNFRSESLSDPHVKDAEHALRTCVHCGFCTATCPTYVLLGDERDSPRGRIMLMQQMLESGGAPNAETVRHLDRCLSCLGCRSACPSGVDYAALIDQSRVHIERHYRRPFPERLFRNFILFVLTRPRLFGALSATARILAPLISWLPGRMGAMARKAGKPPLTRNLLGKFRPAHRAEVIGGTNPAASEAPDTRRVLVLPGCVQRALAPEIDSAVTRVLVRQGDHVDCLHKSGCCGSLAFHLGKADVAKQQGRDLIRACEAAGESDAILISASGCTGFLKDYGRLFADDPEWQARAEKLAAKARDFVELTRPVASPSAAAQNAGPLAFHPPCSLQHGQRISGLGEALLRSAGFKLVSIPDAHLCCGSAGSYSLLQPEIAERLRAKKLADIKTTGATAIVSDNVGCLSHLSGELPVFHIAEALDEARE